MAHDLLRGYAIATFETSAAAGELASAIDALDAFSAALTTSDTLRTVMTDATVSPITRRDIAAELLSGKASQPLVDLVDFAVRVVRPSELPLALADVAALGREV